MNTHPAAIRVAIIAAIGTGPNPETNGVYGNDGKLPWPRLSKDFAWFKEKTAGHTVIMGRGTWDSLEKFKPLPNRLNIVVSNSLPEGKNLWNNEEKKVFFVCRSPDQAFELAKEMESEKNIFFIGGYDLWHRAIHWCTDLFITNVYGNWGEGSKGDLRKFPELLDPALHFLQFNICLTSKQRGIEEIDGKQIALSFCHYTCGHLSGYNE